MKEIDELKRKVYEIGVLFAALLRALFHRVRLRIGLSRSIRKWKKRHWGIAVLAVFLVLLLLTALAGLIGAASNSAGPALRGLGRTVFGINLRLPGGQGDGSFVFADFEDAKALAAWDGIHVQASITEENSSEGKHAVRMVFDGTEHFGSFFLDDLMRNRSGGSDWSGFETLQFSLFSPRGGAKAVTLILTDVKRNFFKEHLSLPAGKAKVFQVPVEKFAGMLDLKKINQIGFFVRTKEEHVVYADDIRLIPLDPGAVRVETRDKVITPSNVGVQPPGVNVLNYGFQIKKAAWTVVEKEEESYIRIPFAVRNETNAACHLCYVEGTLPFPIGELKSVSNMRVRNARFEDLPFEAQPLVRWPDGSIKWAHLLFQSSFRPGEGQGFFADYGPFIKAMEFDSPLAAKYEGDMLEVETGPAKFRIPKNRNFLFDTVWVDQDADGRFGEAEVAASGAYQSLRFRGSEYRTDKDPGAYRLELEHAGKRRLVVKQTGWYVNDEGRPFCQSVVRMTFYAGQSMVKLSHTWIYTGYPANRANPDYRDLDLPENETLESLNLSFPYRFNNPENVRVHIGRLNDAALSYRGGTAVHLIQTGYHEAELKSDEVAMATRDAYSGWSAVSDGEKGISVFVRDFRENYPKGIYVDETSQVLHVELWPKDAGELNLETTQAANGDGAMARGSAFGLAKTHEVFLDFHRGDSASPEIVNRAMSQGERLLLRPNPWWVDATGVLGRLFPADKRYARMEGILEGLFDWAARHPKTFQWYGMIDYGDTQTWWRNGDESKTYTEWGWHPDGRWGWYNVEGQGTHTGALIQFLRTGDWKYFEFGENLARHVMDIDTIHYDTVLRDPRLRGKIDPKYSQVGSMHRHNADHWGGRSDEASHTNIAGLALYYQMTGDERAMDVLDETGRFYLSQPYTYIGHPDLAPHRAMANALQGDVILYHLTGNEEYKKAADDLIEIFLKGQQEDGSFLDNFNPLDSLWSGRPNELFMGLYDLKAFMDYYELTQDPRVAAMILKATAYLAPSQYMGPQILHAMAFSYFLSRDPWFITMAEKQMAVIQKARQNSPNPMLNGLIWNKPVYHRPMAFLSSVPYVFGALEVHFDEMKMRRRK